MLVKFRNAAGETIGVAANVLSVRVAGVYNTDGVEKRAFEIEYAPDPTGDCVDHIEAETALVYDDSAHTLLAWMGHRGRH